MAEVVDGDLRWGDSGAEGMSLLGFGWWEYGLRTGDR